MTIEGRFVDNALVETSGATLRAYRAKVRNKQKPLFNTAAENTIAWLILDDQTEPFQLSWVREKESVTLNVDDSREI